MTRFFTLLGTLTLLLVFTPRVAAQQIFPVVLQQQLAAPPQSVTDLASDARSGWNVQLQLLDPNESEVQVVLRFKIDGPNLRIRSKVTPTPVIHVVRFGQPLMLTGQDLAYLVNPANLDVAGAPIRDFFANGGRLPEGLYNICVEAFILNRADQAGVSNESCLPLLQQILEPPTITYPLDQQSIPAIQPQSFGVTWQTVNPAANERYEVSIAPYGEAIPGPLTFDQNGTPQNLVGGAGSINGNISSSQPVNGRNLNLFNANANVSTANQTFVPLGDVRQQNPPVITDPSVAGLQRVIGPGDAPLMQGQWYVVQVRAFDPMGRGTYRNDGWSLPVVFQYGEPCLPVNSVNAVPVADTRVRMSWSPTVNAVGGYRVFIRNQTLPAFLTRWYEVSTTIPGLLLDRLEPNTEYQYIVSSVCSGGQSQGVTGYFTTPRPPNVSGVGGDPEDGDGPPPTTPGNFTTGGGNNNDDTEEYNPVIAECTDNPAIGEGVNGTPDAAQKVTKGSEFTVSGMTVRAVTAAGGDSFTGKGTVLIPWLEQGALAVDFANVKLGSDRKMVAGSITTMRGKTKIDVSQFRTLLGEAEECANYTERQLDDRGFSADGFHYLTGTKLDPRGFDQSGLYHGDTYTPNGGAPRDPRGFDANGLHSNGTRYDDNGCNRDSLNQHGQPCVWRAPGSGGAQADASTGGPSGQDATGSGAGNSSNNGITPTGPTAPGPATVSGTSFHNEKGPVFWREQTERAIDTMLLRTQIGIDQVGFLISAGTTFISGYIFATGLDRALLVGDNDELLQPGMSSLYPNGMPPPDTTDTDLAYRGYDAMIRRLYHTDRYVEDTLKPLKVAYELHETDPELADLVNHVRQHVKALNDQELQTLRASESALFNWVRERVATKMTQLSLNPSAGYSQWTNPAEERRNLFGPLSPMLADLNVTINAGEAAGAIPGGWSSVDPSTLDHATLRRLESMRTESVKDYIKSLKSIDYSPKYGFKLPIKITKQIGGKTYGVYIDELKIGANGWEVTAFMIMPLPGKDGDYVVFKGEDIPISEEGIVGEPKLSLANQLDIGMGTYGTFSFVGGSENYVKFDCRGYKEFKLAGEVLFCRDKLIPLNPDGTAKEAPANQAAAKAPRVKANLSLQGSSWLNFVTEVGVQGKFAVKDLRDMWWEATGNVVIDFSEDTSSVNMVFPKNYISNYVGGGNKPAPGWQGVFVPNIKGTLDILENRTRPDEKLSLQVRNFLIDDTGLTIHATGENLLSLPDGKVGNWSIAVDSADVYVLQNTWKTAALKGKVQLPTSAKDTLGYLAQASEGGYFSFAVEVTDTTKLSWDAWDGSMALRPNSEIEVGRSTEQGWYATAKLYGTLDLGIKESSKFKAPEVVFDDFRLATFSPYVSLGEGGRFGITNMEAKIKGFGIEIKEFSLVKPPKKPNSNFERLGIKINGKLGLMGEKGGFGVAGGCTVIGELDDSDPDDLDIVYDTTTVDDIFLSVKAPGLFIAGGIRFFDESKANGAYGSGFQGLVDARFDGVGIGVTAGGMFGSMPKSKGDYRYWMVDAGLLLKMPTASVPIVGALHLTGIGGGASYHMTRSDRDPKKPVEVTFGKKPTEMPPLGTSLSGLTFVPNADAGLGLRLMTAMATYPSPTIFNGSLVLGIEFTSSWGLNKVYLAGSASLATPTNEDGTPLKGANPAVALGMDIEYLHRDRTVSGSLHGWVNYPPIKNKAIVVGRRGTFDSKSGYVGQIEFMMSPNDSYLWAGKPYRRPPEADERLGLQLKTPFTADVNGYFAFGSKLPPPAQIPKSIYDDSEAVRNMNFDLPAMDNGLAFGAEISIPSTKKTADPWVGPDFDYHIEFLAGFNIALTSNMRCDGKEAGFNGWFAAGNIYAKGSISALGESATIIGAAAVSGPNPFYAAGTFEVDVPLIPTFDASGEIGTPCKNGGPSEPPPVAEFRLPYASNELIVSSSLDADDRPALGDVIEFKLAGDNLESFFILDGSTRREFRLHVRESNVTVSHNTGERVIISGNTVTIRPPVGGWKPNRRAGARVIASLEEKVNNNWQVYRVNGNGAYFKHDVVKMFTTPDVPEMNIIQVRQPLDGADAVSRYTYINFKARTDILAAYIDQVYSNADVAKGDETVTLADSLGNDIPVKRYYNNGGYGGQLLGYGPVDGFISGMRYTATIEYKARYVQGYTSYYVQVDGRDHVEEKQVVFTIKARPAELTAEHVERSYPESMQYNVYPDQTNDDCFVVFKQDLRSLLGPNWINTSTQDVYVRYVDNVTDAVVHRDGLTVDGNTATWAAIPDVLEGDKTYRVEFYADAKNATTDGGRAPDLINAGDENTTPGGNPVGNGQRFYVNYLRISTFATFGDKINDIGWAAGQSYQRRGVMSPTYWDDPVMDNYGTRPVPYKVDMSNRPLGYVGYREAVGLTELFSRQELDRKIAIEVQTNSYYDEIGRDYLNFSRVLTASLCGTGGGGTVGVTIKDEIPANTIYLAQGIPGPSLTETSGHGIGTLPLLSDPQTEIFAADMISGSAPHDRLDGTMPGVRYADGGLRSVAPLVLVNDFHRKVVEQYNGSWLFRTRADVVPCDSDDLNVDDLDGDLRDGLAVFDDMQNVQNIIDNVTDAIITGNIPLPDPGGGTIPGAGGQNGGVTLGPDGTPVLGGGGLPDVNGGGGTPTTTPDPNGGGGTPVIDNGDPAVNPINNGGGTPTTTPVNQFVVDNTQFTMSNGAGGVSFMAQMGAQNVYGAQNLDAVGNDFVDRNINTYGAGGFNGGFFEPTDYETRLRRLFLPGMNELPKTIPSPVGRSMPVKIAYRIPKLAGGFEVFYSTVIDTKY